MTKVLKDGEPLILSNRELFRFTCCDCGLTHVIQRCACGAMRMWEFVGHLLGKGKEAEMFKNCKYCSKPAEGKCEICGAPICPDHTEYARYLVICTPCKDKEARAS